MESKDYVIEVSSPSPTYLGQVGDEDDPSVLPRTTDPALALRFARMQDANKELRRVVGAFPLNAFRVNVLAKLPSAHRE